jgi:hypothetical protein
MASGASADGHFGRRNFEITQRFRLTIITEGILGFYNKWHETMR